MRKFIIITTALYALLLAACGGSASPQDLIKAEAKGFVSDLRKGNIADACARFDNPDKCEGQMATAKAFVGDIGKFVPSDEDARINNATITVNGDRATMVTKVKGDDPTHYVKRGGKWLEVWTHN